jgi:hypothetical protein
MKKFSLLLCFLLLSSPALSSPAMAENFSFTFKWGDIPLCTSGKPNIVENPFFMITDAPPHTEIILFKMVDEDVPTYKHGGGEVKYHGENMIKPGAFTYKSPCPPNGPHTYTWTAYALDKNRRVLATAQSAVRYPQ